MNGFIRLQQVWERHVLQTPAATNISNWLPAEVCRPRWSESRPPFLAGPSQEPMVVSLAHYEWNLGKDLDAFGALSPGLGMAYQPLDEQCRWPNWETSKTSFFSVSLKKAIWGPHGVLRLLSPEATAIGKNSKSVTDFLEKKPLARRSHWWVRVGDPRLGDPLDGLRRNQRGESAAGTGSFCPARQFWGLLDSK